MKWYLLLGTLVLITFSCNQKSTSGNEETLANRQDNNSYDQSLEQNSISEVLDSIDSSQNLDSLLSLFTLSERFLENLNRNKEFFFVGSPYIKKEDAKARIAIYKAHETILRARLGEIYDPTKDIYGFTFKLENLEDFLNKIKQHNINHAGDSTKLIVGVRAYRSWRSIESKLVPEIFLMPTIASRGNLYQNVDSDLSVGIRTFKNSLDSLLLFESLKNQDESGDLILDTSIPCPNNCN